MNPGVSSWLKFNAVGIVGMGIQLLALALLRGVLGFGVRLSTALAVECAVLHNFVWHERWTWAHRGLGIRGVPGRLIRFNVSNGLVSILGNLAVMEVLVSRLHLHYMVSNVAAIGICSLINFFISDKLVFKEV